MDTGLVIVVIAVIGDIGKAGETQSIITHNYP
jgi:hypothetical protein